MGKFVKGEVVVFPFPFTDPSQTKVRPCLVVANLTGPDMILCSITKTPRPDSIPLRQSDFKSGGLPIDPSYIRPTRLFTAKDTRVLLSRGQVTETKVSEVTSKIVEIVTR